MRRQETRYTSFRSVRVGTTGSVAMSCRANVLSLSAEDRAFIEGLLAAMDRYEAQSQSTAASRLR